MLSEQFGLDSLKFGVTAIEQKLDEAKFKYKIDCQNSWAEFYEALKLYDENFTPSSRSTLSRNLKRISPEQSHKFIPLSHVIFERSLNWSLRRKTREFLGKKTSHDIKLRFQTQLPFSVNF